MIFLQKSTVKYEISHTISRPFAVLCVFGWSILNPSLSQRYCWAVRLLASLSVRGHWKLPDSKRLYSSTNPLPSQYSYLSLVQMIISPFTVNTPCVFLIAGDAGGIKQADSIFLLSILPRFVIL